MSSSSNFLPSLAQRLSVSFHLKGLLGFGECYEHIEGEPRLFSQFLKVSAWTRLSTSSTVWPLWADNALKFHTQLLDLCKEAHSFQEKVLLTDSQRFYDPKRLWSSEGAVAFWDLGKGKGHDPPLGRIGPVQLGRAFRLSAVWLSEAAVLSTEERTQQRLPPARTTGIPTLSLKITGL